MESVASPMWKRKEMGLAQKPSAQAKVELAEMGRAEDEGQVGGTDPGPAGWRERNLGTNGGVQER